MDNEDITLYPGSLNELNRTTSEYHYKITRTKMIRTCYIVKLEGVMF